MSDYGEVEKSCQWCRSISHYSVDCTRPKPEKSEPPVAEDLETVEALVANIKDCMKIVGRACATGGTNDSRGVARLTRSLYEDVEELAKRIGTLDINNKKLAKMFVDMQAAEGNRTIQRDELARQLLERAESTCRLIGGTWDKWKENNKDLQRALKYLKQERDEE